MSHYDDIVEPRTGEPLHLGNRGEVANSVDFWYAANTYLDLADNFLNHLAAKKLWNDTFHSHDPITAQKQFFLDMRENNTVFEIKNTIVHILHFSSIY